MILKAIHNQKGLEEYINTVASHHANLWFWKQFTTHVNGEYSFCRLRVITQTYDFESNSQQYTGWFVIGACCESSRKPMILKAIHNFIVV